MYRAFKWIMDRFLALVALSIVWPLLIAIAIIIVIDSHGGAFIVQTREGQNQKPIRVIKFRTMYSSKVEFDPEHAVIDRNNENVTNAGKWLRASKLDELPQLINVLKGDMSFVGPRPLLPVYSPKYERWEFQKFTVKPGITGLSQVHGNGHLRTQSRSYYDVLYSEKISLWTDFVIVCKTIKVMFKGERSLLKEVSDSDIEKMRERYQ